MRTIQLVFLIILLLGISCNKEKIFISNADLEGAVCFFPEDTSPNAAYSPIIDFIKSSDPSGSLVQKLANECGKPLWDKTAFSDEIFKHIGTDQLQASSQNNGRFLVLPFVRDSLIKSVLVCEIDNNNRVLKSKLINSKDHTKWTTKKTTGRMSADELATLFIVENYRVYGFRNFKLNDNRVFSNQTNFIKTEPRTAILREIQHQPTDQLRSLSTESVWITNTFCAVIEVPCSGDLAGVAPGQQTNYMCPVLTCIQWKQLLQDEFLPDPINYNGQGTPLESDLFSSGGGGSSTTTANLSYQLGLTANQSLWLESNPARTAEIDKFLNNTNYSDLSFEDKRELSISHLNSMMTDLNYLQMVDSYSTSVVSLHPWMIELFKELGIEIALKVIRKYLPGYGDWQSIKDAIDNAGHGDWLGTLGEILNIVKKKVPWLAAVDAIIDVFDFGTLANKAWKAFNRIRELPTPAFNGLLKTIKEKCGGVLGNFLHDDLSSGTSQAFIKYNTADASEFFQSLANNMGKTINSTSNGGRYFDVDHFRFNFYLDASSIPHLPTIEIILPGNNRYKLRITN